MRNCLALHWYKFCYTSAHVNILSKPVVDITTVIFETVLSCTELRTNVPKYNTEQKYPITSRELTDIHKVYPSLIRHLVVYRFSIIMESEHSLPISLQTVFRSLLNVPKNIKSENTTLFNFASLR